ncbi:MAG: CRISPR-associated endonuclease Cas1 [Bacteroidales bacterium]|nr:CRISPR-associated endonuclease Cas1 [Bacteroidales bacterium]
MELILNTFGTSLSRDNEAFVVVHKDGRQRIPVIGIDAIQISRGAQITSDAVLLAIEHEIAILFMNNSGMPVGRVWSSKYGSISTIRKGQLEFSFSSSAVEWIKKLIMEKIEGQQALLLSFVTTELRLENLVNSSVNKLEDYRNKINNLQGEIVPDIAPQLRGWEGVSSRIYFQCINQFLPEVYRFAERSQHPAMDIVNAMLNYGYGVMYGKIESALIKAGIDPYVGIFHRDDYNRPVLVFDVIERFRVWVDFVVFSIAAQKVISEEYFSTHEDRSVWLEGLGKRVLIQSLNDYLEEIISIKGLSRSRLSHIDLYAQSLAQLFKTHIS